MKRELVKRVFLFVLRTSRPYRSAAVRLCRRNLELQSYSIINTSESQQPGKIPAGKRFTRSPADRILHIEATAQLHDEVLVIQRVIAVVLSPSRVPRIQRRRGQATAFALRGELRITVSCTSQTYAPAAENPVLRPEPAGNTGQGNVRIEVFQQLRYVQFALLLYL
jgi:hypothetical protein